METNAKILKLKADYKSIYSTICQKTKKFRKIKESGKDIEILNELLFCILTPQSKAKICWNAVVNLCSYNDLRKLSEEEILNCLSGVRFKYTKAKRIMKIIERYYSGNKHYLQQIISNFSNPVEIREWLVRNIDGIGYKEASHFLRNIGMGKELAILDRHILKNIKKYKVISEIPKSLSKNKYLEIERQMQKFAKKIKIPMEHLDLLLWYMETGEVFK